jgi:putative acetyltransferase
MMHRLEIRDEAPADVPGIRIVHAAAFPTHAEADLVDHDQLRRDGSAVYSLVAGSDERVVGHAMFSRMELPEGSLGMAPVAVLESHRGRGLAARLIREGLAKAKADGWKSVFVLGDPYYTRFGFDPRLAEGFASPYAGPHFMALELQAGAFTAAAGDARYAKAFAALG